MLTVKNLVKTYHTKGGIVTKALDNVTVDFPETGMVFLLGKSGSGKSTLLNMIGGLDRPDGGEVIVKGKSSKDFTTKDFDSYRNTFIGFIFQEYNILNEFNVEQNIALALQLQGKKANREAIANLLKEVDLVGLEKRKPYTLSGGQKQRIAIARALIKEPQIIMADEPTGALDSNTGKQVFDTLKKLSANKLVIVVSHDREFAQQYGDRIIELKDGKIISDDSKVYQQAKKVSDNVNLISGNVIQIKNAAKLSAKDDKAIIEALKKQKGEIIISGGDHNLPNVKKALKINESGASESFDKTTKVNIKQYDGNQTKFIKSKMPFWRAFKIGASGLKVKPFRLIMTILLSTVSFGMFGVVSALMLYNANYSVREAMRNVDYKTETISKKYKYINVNSIIDYDTSARTEKGRSEVLTAKTLFGIQDLNNINNNNAGLKFAGEFDYGNSSYGNGYYIDSLRVSGEAKDYYAPGETFSGFSDCGEQYMLNQGFSNCPDGKYPSENNEVAISDYVADLIINNGLIKGAERAQDLLNKEVTIQGSAQLGALNEKMKIVGIYHIADIPHTYESLKKERDTANQSEEDRSKLKLALSNFINGGFFRTLFVSDGFYDAHKNLVGVPTFNSYTQSAYVTGIHFDYNYPYNQEISKDWGTSVYDFDYVNNTKVFQFYNMHNDEKVELNTLAADEAIISLDTYNTLITSSIGKYGLVKNQFVDMKERIAYTPDYFESDVKNAITSVDTSYFKHFFEILTTYPVTFDSEFFIDYEYIKECVDTYYKKVKFIEFANNHAWDIINVADNDPTIKNDPIWTAAKASLQKTSYPYQPLTDNDIYCIDIFLDNYVGNVDGLKIPLFEYIGKNICDVGSIQFNYLIYGEGGTGGYHSLLNELQNSQIISENFKTQTQELYKILYGKSLNLDDKASFYPENRALFAPVSNLESYYFYKTGNSVETIKRLNVNYYYKSSERYNSTLIINHELVKEYIRDKNVWVSEIETNYTIPEDAKYNGLMTKSTYTDNEINVLLQEFDNCIYEMNNLTYQQILIMINLINQFKQIFLYVGIGTGALAALLLANFISASINNKKKDIGILRAVGAKSVDVFKVFWSESGIITTICFLLATIAAAFTSTALNNVIVGTIIGIKVLNFGIINIAIILAAAILISILATLFPVLHAAKKPPVEAIRSL